MPLRRNMSRVLSCNNFELTDGITVSDLVLQFNCSSGATTMDVIIG